MIPLLLGALALLFVQARQEQRQAQDQLAVYANSLLQAFERELALVREQLEVLASSPFVDDQNWPLLHRFAVQVADRNEGSVIGLVGPDGQQIFNTVSPLGSPQPNLWRMGDARQEANWEGKPLPLSSQTLTRHVFERREAAYSDLYFGNHVKRPALAISIPVKRNGEVRYALTLSFPPQRLQGLVDTTVTTPGLRAGIVDRQGLVVAANATAASGLADKITPLPDVARSRAGTYEIRSRDGAAVEGAFVTSVKNGYTVRVSRPKQTLLAFMQSATAGWLLLVILALLVSIYMATRFSRRIAAPLLILGNAAKSGRPPPALATEIEEIQALGAALRSSAESNQQRHDASVREAKREESEAALKRADRQKDEFLATLAHELRNPLAPIRSGLHILATKPTDEQTRRLLAVMSRHTHQIVRLIDDLLDVSRISRGQMELRLQRVDLDTVIKLAVNAVQPALASRRQRLVQTVPQEPVCLEGDSDRIAQVVTNLLTNASRYSPDSTEIHLSLTSKDTSVIIAVADRGQGISEDRKNAIFEMFATFPGPAGETQAGLGIGLALCKKIVQLHGGHIWLESEGIARGSTFYVELPRTRQSVSDMSPAQARNRV